jgi:hypothetical protein
MKTEDFKAFANAWTDTHEIMAGGKVLSNSAMTKVFEALMDYPLAAINDALRQHCKQAKFAPTPHDIIDILQGGRSQHYAADEAWSLVLQAFDETETVVLTREMLEAKGVVQEIYDTGDIVGARMAFRAAYERIIRSAPAPVWQVSTGFDAAKRVEAVRLAVDRGLLPPGSEKKYLTQQPQDAGAIAGLLTGKVSELPNNQEHLKNRWHGLRQALADGLAKAEAEHQAEREAAAQRRLAFEEKRQAAIAVLNAEMAKSEVA